MRALGSGWLSEKHTATTSVDATCAQVMVKLRNSRNLDARQSALVDSAYFAVHPPERVGARRKKRPPEHEYIRHLILESLSKDEVKPVGGANPAAVSCCESHTCGPPSVICPWRALVAAALWLAVRSPPAS